VRTSWCLLLGLTSACSGDTTEGSDDMDTEMDDDGSHDTDTGACTALAEGSWSAGGTCFGHEMSATLALEPDGCGFTLTDWSMAMSTPSGGTVTSSDVVLDGQDWDDCTGTTDGQSISGACGDGCTFDLTFGG
jgi:hypothetical protein